MLAVTGEILIHQLGSSFPFGLVRLPVVGDRSSNGGDDGSQKVSAQL